MNRSILTTALLACATVTLSACGDKSDSAAQNAPTQPSPSASAATFLLASAPDGAVSIGEAKTSATEGEDIILRGKIGGRISPMSDESAIFMMMDLTEKSCDQLHADQCPTPWDYCCTPADRIKTLSCTVQLVGADGKPLTINLQDSGIKPLDEVVVVGTVAPRANQDVLIVQATGIHRVGS